MPTIDTIHGRMPPMFVVLLLGLALAGPAPAAAAQTPAPAQAPMQRKAPARETPLDQILKEVAFYDGGIESAALWKLRDYVSARKNDRKGRAECEAKLLEFLKSSATPAARMAAARHLRAIAGNAAVPALHAMLGDDRLADTALYALQGIPGAAAEDVLIQTVKADSGATKAAAIAALGERRAAPAVSVLAPLLTEPAFSEAASVALGRIGGDAAAAVLEAAFATAPADLKPGLASGMLACADLWLAAKNTGAARRLYEKVSADVLLPVPLRRAAGLGRIPAAGTGAGALLLELLGGADPVMQEAAIARMAAVIPPDGIEPVCAMLPRLPESAQVQVLAVLARYPSERVLPAVLRQVKSESLQVRIAAMRALESTGGPSVVPMLAETAARTRGPEQAAARVALGMLKGQAVDDAILALLAKKASDDLQRELLLAIADRRIFAAKVPVAAMLTSESPRIRIQALRTLRVIGTPSDVSTVLDALVASADESERAEAEQTVAALTRKITNPDARAGAIRTRLAAEKAVEARVRYLGVLPIIGDRSTLPLLRAALEDKEPDVVDAAVRALAAWPTSAARDDLLRVTRDSKNETLRVLALRALVRSVGLEPYRDPEAAVADLKVAASLAWRPEEQTLVLGALSQFPCQGALEVAKGFLKEPAVQAEAKAAVDAVTARLAKRVVGK